MPLSLHERQIIAWLAILLGAYFFARALGSKRDKHAMKELLGVPIDKVKFFRNFFIQRLEAIAGFLFTLVGVGIHLYVQVREAQDRHNARNPQEALSQILLYLGIAVVVMLLITWVMQAICSYFARKTFLDILAYLMVRYDYRVAEDPRLLMQIGKMLGLRGLEDDTVESYTKRIEAGLHLEEIRERLRAMGKHVSLADAEGVGRGLRDATARSSDARRRGAQGAPKIPALGRIEEPDDA
jgi:hypothetical protein